MTELFPSLLFDMFQKVLLTASFWSFHKKIGVGEGSAAKTTGCSFTGPGSILAPTWQLTAVTPAPGDVAPSFELRAPGTNVVHRHICM